VTQSAKANITISSIQKAASGPMHGEGYATVCFFKAGCTEV
jgi:hypothetical protein